MAARRESPVGVLVVVLTGAFALMGCHRILGLERSEVDDGAAGSGAGGSSTGGTGGVGTGGTSAGAGGTGGAVNVPCGTIDVLNDGFGGSELSELWYSHVSPGSAISLSGGQVVATLEDASKDHCSPDDANLCTDYGHDLREKAFTSAHVSTGTFIAGVLLTAGLILFLTAPDDADAGADVALELTPTGLSLRGLW